MAEATHKDFLLVRQEGNCQAPTTSRIIIGIWYFEIYRKCEMDLLESDFDKEM